MKPINVNELYQRCLGQIDFAEEILEAFIESSRSDIDQMTELVGGDELDTLRVTAHRLKGTAATVAANRLAECFKAIEQFAGGETNVPIMDRLAETRDEWSRVKTFFDGDFSEEIRTVDP